MALCNLMKLTKEDVDQALRNNGYTDNALRSVKYDGFVAGKKDRASLFVYKTKFWDPSVEGGIVNDGRVYIYICTLTGEIKGDY